MTTASTLQTTNIRDIHLPDISEEDFLKTATVPVANDLKKVEINLRTSLQSNVEGVPEMMAYLIESGGKRIRPLVTCLIAKACGYEGEDHIPIACVSELLHTATLYHDDVVDESKMRRGKPTANSLFGNKIMVLSGDLMLAHCFSILMDGGFFKISQALSQTVKQMVEGEILELKCEGDFETSIDDYLTLIDNKTASLFSWSTKAAGLISKCSRQNICELENFGYHIGMAFQLVDDLMDFIGNPLSMGKRTLQDLETGKITLPLLVVLKNFPELKKDLAKEFQQLFAKNGVFKFSEPVLEKIKQSVHDPRVMAENLYLIRKMLNDARKNLAFLPASTYRTGLISLIEFLGTRNR